MGVEGVRDPPSGFVLGCGSGSLRCEDVGHLCLGLIHLKSVVPQGLVNLAQEVGGAVLKVLTDGETDRPTTVVNVRDPSSNLGQRSQSAQGARPVVGSRTAVEFRNQRP